MKNETLPIEVQWLYTMPIQSFKICFIIGTLLLAFFALTENISIAIIGFIFLVIAVVCNLILFCIQIINSFVYRKYQKQILLHTAVMLINIPIAVLYFYIVNQFLLT